MGLDLPGLHLPSWKKRQGQHSNLVSKGSKCLNTNFLNPLEASERGTITSVEKGGLWMIPYSRVVAPFSLLKSHLLSFLAGLYFNWFNGFGRATALEPDPPPSTEVVLVAVPHIPPFLLHLIPPLAWPQHSTPSTTSRARESPLPGQDTLCNAGEGPRLQC